MCVYIYFHTKHTHTYTGRRGLGVGKAADSTMSLTTILDNMLSLSVHRDKFVTNVLASTKTFTNSPMPHDRRGLGVGKAADSTMSLTTILDNMLSLSVHRGRRSGDAPPSDSTTCKHDGLMCADILSRSDAAMVCSTRILCANSADSSMLVSEACRYTCTKALSDTYLTTFSQCMYSLAKEDPSQCKKCPGLIFAHVTFQRQGMRGCVADREVWLSSCSVESCAIILLHCYCHAH